MQLASLDSPAAVTISVVALCHWQRVQGGDQVLSSDVAAAVPSVQLLSVASVSPHRLRRSCAVNECSAKKHVVAQRLVPVCPTTFSSDVRSREKT